jgi:hypothetical protein
MERGLFQEATHYFRDTFVSIWKGRLTYSSSGARQMFEEGGSIWARTLSLSGCWEYGARVVSNIVIIARGHRRDSWLVFFA